MTLHRALHLDIVAIIRCQEIGADQQQDDFILVNFLIDCLVDILTCPDTAIMPSIDHTLPFKHSELLLKLVSQRLVCM
jgi:hypothetical protein